MKILDLRFKNLNSLYGGWFIDFTAPEYALNGIFAITGPTGSGKSTLLDAVCLALYGRTPRLNLITKTSNEVMSRRTGECFAQVTFETQAGRFRCHWSQRRAGQKPDGNLQDAKHEISDADTGQVLESGKREVAIKIEQTTGMDFVRFTRSMLLAQGGFAAFLAATPDERSPILEQITGTAIYSEISKLVHLRKAEENKKLDQLTAETAGIVLFTDEEETQVLEALENKKALENISGQKINKARIAILWLTGMDTLKNELLSIRAEAEQHARVLTAFEPDLKRLKAAQKASELDSTYARLKSLRDQQASDLDAFLKIKALIPEKQKIFEIKEAALSEAETDLLSVKAEEKQELFLIKTVRAMDFKISEIHAFLKTLALEKEKIESELAREKERKKKAEQNLALAEKNLLETNAYLLAHAADQGLLTQLAGIFEQVRTLKAAREKQVLAEKELSGLQKKLEAAKKNCHGQAAVCQCLGEKHDAALSAVRAAKKDIEALLGGRLLREYRAEHESLLREVAYVRKILSLEQERENLKPGTPCPLCGSLDHPFALGHVPPFNETEEKISYLTGLIQKAEAFEKLQKDRESLERTSGLNLAEAEKHLVLVQHQEAELIAAIQRAEKEILTRLDESARQKADLIHHLQSFGIDKISDERLDDLTKSLEKRRKNFQDHQDQQIKTEKLKDELAARISGMDRVIKTLEDRMGDIREKAKKGKKEQEAQVFERTQCYGHKIPDTEEARLEKKVEEIENIVKKARKTRDDIRADLREGLTRMAALKEATTVRQSELSALEASFGQACRDSGFETETAFYSAGLSLDERKRLMEKVGKLDETAAKIAARKTDRENRLLIESEKKLTNQGLEDLKKEEAALHESLKRLGEEIGALKQKLFDNASAKEKLQDKKNSIDLQKKECARWDSLHGLIGSADGKKYRNFAQGLTFEIMVAHANGQLEKMSDRYLLIRDESQPLELNIVDNYQAGEIRSTKNLSGGESFIVSLSLALGLSHMSGRKIRVDSLFLDEGFGTLDEDALETALEAMAGLYRQGKLIGIISHVPALKERISTRISVTPASGGKSTLTGPGCRAL